MNNEHIHKLKAYGIIPADYDEFELAGDGRPRNHQPV